MVLAYFLHQLLLLLLDQFKNGLDRRFELLLKILSVFLVLIGNGLKHMLKLFLTNGLLS